MWIGFLHCMLQCIVCFDTFLKQPSNVYSNWCVGRADFNNFLQVAKEVDLIYLSFMSTIRGKTWKLQKEGFKPVAHGLKHQYKPLSHQAACNNQYCRSTKHFCYRLFNLSLHKIGD